MARRGDGIYPRGRTWWLDFSHHGRHTVCQTEGDCRPLDIVALKDSV